MKFRFKLGIASTTTHFFRPILKCCRSLEAYLDKIRAERDSVGARITVVAEGCPVGWGEPVFDRLDADIAHAMMSINAVKGVEIGAGFAAIAQRGSVHSDEMTPQGFATNHAGGILGGISSGQEIRVNIALKPTSSIPQAAPLALIKLAMPLKCKPQVATTRAWACAPRQLPKRCWRLC